MFDHFVWSVLVVPLLVVAAAALLADRLTPAAGASALAWSAAGAALAGTVNLAAFTVAAAVQIPAVAERFGCSSQTVARDTANVPWVPWVSAALLAGSVAAAARVRRRHRRGRAAAREFAGLPGGQVVVVDSAAVDAFAVPGRPGRVVATTAMRAALDDDQFAALVAHERAHLDAGHPRLVLLAELAGAAHPALWWVASRVLYLIERAADEQAAGAVGDRRTVATAIGAAALAASRAPAAPAPAHTSFARPRRGAIPRRVGELLTPTPHRLTWLLTAPALLAASSLVWTGEAVYDLLQLLHQAHTS
ncbi:M56 family metallopeptidase [Spirillospora albida]|uniref:M56 family metallopeptidase n=1 Tax=Spirillospora albida TaxID=58123 RepID=UPI0004BFDC22|nr:M56 family metallopeptidase [Spirillospora albida]